MDEFTCYSLLHIEPVISGIVVPPPIIDSLAASRSVVSLNPIVTPAPKYIQDTHDGDLLPWGAGKLHSKC